MRNKHLNLAVDEEVIKKIKMRAIEENRTVSEITEQLYRQYLSIENSPRLSTRTYLEHPKKVKPKQ
jgi:hypothetical protein